MAGFGSLLSITVILAILFSYIYKPDCVCVIFLYLLVLDVQALNEKEMEKKGQIQK